MAIIQFDNGTKVNFNGTPTPQDVNEVAQKLGMQGSESDQAVLNNYNQYHNSGAGIDAGFGNDGFGSGTAKNVEDFKNMSSDSYQNSIISGALLPSKMPDNMSDFEPVSTLASGAANTVSDAWLAAKGLLTLPFHLNDFIKQAVQDPTFLLGPAAQQLANGFMSTIQTGDFSNLWKGLKYAGVAAINHPLLSVLPFLGLEEAIGGKVGGAVTEGGNAAVKTGGVVNLVKELTTSPVSSMKDAFMNAAKSTASKGLGLLDSFFSKDPNINIFKRMSNGVITSGKIAQQTSETLGAIDNHVSSLLSERESIIPQLQKMTEDDPQIEKLRTRQEEIENQLSTAQTLREEIINSNLRTMEHLNQINLGDNNSLVSTGQSIADALDRMLVSIRGTEDNPGLYNKILPNGTSGSIEPIIRGLQSFSDWLKQGVNKAAQSKVDAFIEQLKAKEVIRPLYDRPTPPTVDEVGRLLAKKLGIKNVETALLKPPTTGFLKYGLQGELYDAIVRDNPSYNHAWMERVNPAVDEVLKSKMTPAQQEMYNNLDNLYKKLAFTDIIKKFRNATTKSAITNLFRNPDIQTSLNGINPQLADLSKSAIMKNLLEESRDPKTNGYNAIKLKSLLKENRPFIYPSDYFSAMKIADELNQIQMTRANIADIKAEVGSTPAEVFKTLQKLDSVDAVNRISKLTKVDPLDLGKAYVRGLVENIDPEYATGKITNIKIDKDFSQLKAIDKGLDSVGGNGPERGQVRKLLLGDEGLQIASELKDKIIRLEELSKSKPTSKIKAVGKVVGGAILMPMHMWWTSARLLQNGIEDLIGSQKGFTNVSENAFRESLNKEPKPGILTKTKQAVRSTAKRTLKSKKTQVGVSAANASLDEYRQAAESLMGTSLNPSQWVDLTSQYYENQ